MPEDSIIAQMEADSTACNSCEYNGICEGACILTEVLEEEDGELQDWDIITDEE